MFYCRAIAMFLHNTVLIYKFKTVQCKYVKKINACIINVGIMIWDKIPIIISIISRLLYRLIFNGRVESNKYFNFNRLNESYLIFRCTYVQVI